MKRSYLTLLFCIALAVPLWASPPIGAVVQTWHYDGTNNTVTLHIINTSGKDITAYSIKIREIYGSHVNEHEYSTDTLALILNIQDLAGTVDGERLHQQFGNGTFQAGTSRDEIMHVQPGLTDYEAVLDTVIYADNTAETNNQEALDRAISMRKAYASTIQITNEIIKRALSNAQDAAPHETAAKEIEQLQRQWEMHHVSNLNAGALHAALTEVKNASTIATQQNITVAAYLSDYVAKKAHLASALLEHAAPKMGGRS